MSLLCALISFLTLKITDGESNNSLLTATADVQHSYSDACSCQLAPKAFYNNLSLGLINLIIIQNCLCVSCLCQGRRFIAFCDKWS